MTEEETYLYKLQGRVLATEKLLVAFLLHYATSTRPDDPVSAINSLEKGLKGGLQHAEFEAGEATDIIWETMGEALEVTINNAREKARAIQRGGHKENNS